MSALIWLAIVAVWGFVLIPMWVRHHDSTLEQRSAERFTTAMRVLSRRGASRLDREFAMRPVASSGPGEGEPILRTSGLTRPPTSAETVHGSGKTATAGGGWHGVPVARPPVPTARPPAASGTNADRRALIRLRRRRLFVLLAAVPVTALLAGLLGGVWLLVQGLADASLVGYAVQLRRVAQADRRVRASRFALDRRIAAERAVRYGHRASGPGVGAVGGVAGPWASGSEPFRLSDPAAVHRGADAGRDDAADDLAVANAQTVDLSQIAAAAATRAAAAGGSPQGRVPEGTVVDGVTADSPADDQATDDPARRRTATARSSTVGATSDSGYAHVGLDDVEFVAEDIVEDFVADTDSDGFTDPGGADDERDPGQAPGSAGGSRPAARAGTRPNTSRPGRVQVNPPGTHGGLTAGPAPVSGSQQPMSGSEDPDEVDELLRRHAVGS
ncbi:hypothetical protein [Protofrankia symbiont of Coriaria ruscifolia]|uniref:hypothetical protein n=1 Tax=Protofrankia symbiont of Coriaria ruscifolia TaxID=1306542 RepID=UPI0010410D88|nr:hypothetical protein [Protofrankia symbiont of Coriaria ruscifolia]